VVTEYTYDALNRKIAETVHYPVTLSGVEGFSKTFRYTYYATPTVRSKRSRCRMARPSRMKNEK
jgi:hypothetical protein